MAGMPRSSVQSERADPVYFGLKTDYCTAEQMFDFAAG
jgi:hypothetical protein